MHETVRAKVILEAYGVRILESKIFSVLNNGSPYQFLLILFKVL
ncbi:MAG: hypothetical protein QXO54_06195 [Candidatus Methanomethylicaceae archaeon]|nr:hypothetical protein [Candidatus Verstraetearchaeota archaeon]